MSSFYAELVIAGHTYPLRQCEFGFTQATDPRGRVQAKVRHGLLHLTLDVPDTDLLLDWAHAAHKPLSGYVTFFEPDQRTARETLSFAAGQCVSYHESFVAGDGAAGAYVCQLTLTSDGLTLAPGGPASPFVPAAAREYAAPAAMAATATSAVMSPVAATALNKQQRYDARMNMMQGARTKLTTNPNEPAQTALTRLERNNVAVERAKLSEHVYHSDKVPPVEEPEGWHMLSGEELADKGVSPEMLLDPASGFKAALYKSSFERPPKLVIAFAGTEDKKDILADLRQGIGLKEKQYNEAMDLASAVTERVGKRSVETTGHSLGGGLASAATVVTGTKGYTFNAAGLHINTVKRAPYEISRAAMHEQGALIDAYRSTSDPLNNAQKAALVTRGVVLPKALGTPRLVTPASAWQHQWADLVKGNPITAAKTMALDGHGISPQMVDHIEAEKDQDTATLTSYLAP
jgi:hypothetical protein